jgi:hypothetical protein
MNGEDSLGTGLVALASSWAPREVEAKPVGEKEEPTCFEVRPATTREALGVLAATERIRAGEEGPVADGWGRLKSVAQGWLPEGLFGELFSPHAVLPETTEAVLKLIRTGAGDEEAHAERQEEVQKQAEQFSWPAVIASHARSYHVGYEETLRQPWPLFLLMQQEVPRLQARSQLRHAEWYAAAKTGELDRIVERAQIREAPRAKEAEPWRQAGFETKEEWKRDLRSRALKTQNVWRQKEAQA